VRRGRSTRCPKIYTVPCNQAAEDAYYDNFTDPMHRAAIRLALTPAPGLQALLVKIRVITGQELDEAASMKRRATEVLTEDVERFMVSDAR
jgi:hypothetical protein